MGCVDEVFLLGGVLGGRVNGFLSVCGCVVLVFVAIGGQEFCW